MVSRSCLSHTLRTPNGEMVWPSFGGERRLPIVKLGERHLGIGVDRGLLVDAPRALERAHIEGILRHAIAGAFALELAVRFLVELGLLQRCHLRFGEHQALLRAPTNPRSSSLTYLLPSII